MALCDVDEKQAAGTFGAFPKAPRYKDFRELLDREYRNIDAVTVGTPDHIHAVATMAAIKMGKHVYCEKPLTRTIYEARAVSAAAREHKVMTQMGNQGHASEGARLTNEWIEAGVIGDVPGGARLDRPRRQSLAPGSRATERPSSRPVHHGVEPVARSSSESA